MVIAGSFEQRGLVLLTVTVPVAGMMLYVTDTWSALTPHTGAPDIDHW